MRTTTLTAKLSTSNSFSVDAQLNSPKTLQEETKRLHTFFFSSELLKEPKFIILAHFVLPSPPFLNTAWFPGFKFLLLNLGKKNL